VPGLEYDAHRERPSREGETGDRSNPAQPNSCTHNRRSAAAPAPTDGARSSLRITAELNSAQGEQPVPANIAALTTSMSNQHLCGENRGNDRLRPVGRRHALQRLTIAIAPTTEQRGKQTRQAHAAQQDDRYSGHRQTPCRRRAAARLRASRDRGWSSCRPALLGVFRGATIGSRQRPRRVSPKPICRGLRFLGRLPTAVRS
jgi:hypothetical protein